MTCANGPLKGGFAQVFCGGYQLNQRNTSAKGTCAGAQRFLESALRLQRHKYQGICIHLWLVDPQEAVCRCDGEAHYHAGCRLCLATRTFPAFLETGPIAKAAMYAKRGARAKWKKAETAEAPAEASAPSC